MQKANHTPVRTRSFHRPKGLALVAAVTTLGVLNLAVYPLPVNLLVVFGTEESTHINLISYAPEVWLSLLAMVFGTLIIVISIASESTPKLIDLFVGDYKSRLFIWLITLAGLENIVLQLVHIKHTLFLDNLIFLNNYLLLPGFIITSIPYIFYILKYTKYSNVIDKLYLENKRTIRKARKLTDDPVAVNASQVNLFETINQLFDFLQYVRFKEPKADILHKFGKSLRYFLNWKKSYPSSYFELGSGIQADISFRTLTGKFEQVAREKTFYEQKILRMLDMSYLVLMQDGHYDLAALCGHELSETGRIAAELNDTFALNAVILHFNTFLRHGINYGLRTKEIRNAYNTVYHYSTLVNFLIRRRETDRIIECCKYLSFYGKEVNRLRQSEPSFDYLLYGVATELKRVLIVLYDEGFDRDLQAQVVALFNDLGSNGDSSGMRQGSGGFRLIQISLSLYYIDRSEMQFNDAIIDRIVGELKLLDAPDAKQMIQLDCEQIRQEKEEFWEDTDQGNKNIFYSPHTKHLSTFRSLFLFRLANA